MAVTTAVRTDAEIKRDVIEELRWDPRINESEVGIQVARGIVTITGAVSSYPKRIAAREAAHRVHGVLDVVDEMTVRLPQPFTRTDQDLARAIRHALEWDVLVPDQDITSTVTHGDVILEGEVRSAAQRRDAEIAVRRLTGVRDVINRIRITGPTVSPGQIKQSIEDALERQAEREARRIGVEVAGSVVTLTGRVRSWGERNAIERVASFSPGVTRVDDRTSVDPSL